MGSKRILIVDDDCNIQVMLRVCLGGPYVVETAPNGRAALDVVGQNPPDLMFLDLAMPVMDGMTLLVELQGIPAACKPRVVVMTAHGSMRTAILAIRLGASDFLEKPFAPEDVRLSAASVLDESPGPPPASAADPDGDYKSVLRSVREALRAGTLRAAEALLMRAGTIADEDTEFLNLAGIPHEAHGRVESVRRFYKKALARDNEYAPALENLCRLTDLRRDGRTSRRVNFGEAAEVALFPQRTAASLSGR